MKKLNGINVVVIMSDNEVSQDPLKSEHLIPVVIGQLLDRGKMNVKVLRTDYIWYGITYKEDIVIVKERLMRCYKTTYI